MAGVLCIDELKSGIGLLRQYHVQRDYSARLIGFAEREGLLGLMRTRREFTREGIAEAACKALGYDLQEPMRKRMFLVLFDFLVDCGYAAEKGGVYAFNVLAAPPGPLTPAEQEAMKAFAGKTEFFDACLAYAGEFLRGKDFLYGFNNGARDVWDRFLGNYEFRILREFLLMAMAPDTIAPACRIMDLCYGTGHGLAMLCRQLPEADITALDFTDSLQGAAASKLNGLDGGVRWMGNSKWKGFGSSLPFEGGTFDRIFFSCGDPYISEDIRSDVYKEIKRVLKPGGILGVASWGYPDPEKKYIKNPWLRKGIFIHDFLESVCAGWHGFHDIKGTIDMARGLGFVNSNPLFTDYHTMDTAVWMFKSPPIEAAGTEEKSSPEGSTDETQGGNNRHRGRLPH